MKCLDSDEQKYPPETGSATIRAALVNVRQTEVQTSMDEFVVASESSYE